MRPRPINAAAEVGLGWIADIRTRQQDRLRQSVHDNIGCVSHVCRREFDYRVPWIRQIFPEGRRLAKPVSVSISVSIRSRVEPRSLEHPAKFGGRRTVVLRHDRARLGRRHAGRRSRQRLGPRSVRPWHSWTSLRGLSAVRALRDACRIRGRKDIWRPWNRCRVAVAWRGGRRGHLSAPRAGPRGVQTSRAWSWGRCFRVRFPKYATKDPNYRILARQRSRFTHYYFYLRDETLGPMMMRVASFFPFQTTYYLNGHSFIEQELKRARSASARPTMPSSPSTTWRRCRPPPTG